MLDVIATILLAVRSICRREAEMNGDAADGRTKIIRDDLFVEPIVDTSVRSFFLLEART